MNPNYRRSLYVVARVGLFLFAWALLLFRLNDVPPGFQHDQTFTGLDALEVLSGRFPIYFPANFGREPLFMYSVAAMFGLTDGRFVWSLRFAAVLWGMLGLATTLVYARRTLSEGAALIAAALMATSFWFLMAARLGLEPIALLPLAMAFLYLLDRGLERPSLPFLAAAGFVGGVAVYTYLAARALILLIPLLLLYEGIVWIRQRRSRDGQNREQAMRLAGLSLSLAVMLAVSAPLLVYLFGHSGAADGRVRELGGPVVAAMRGDLKPILANAFDTVRSVLWSGSEALPYHYNLPGRAVLQPILAIVFLVGLIATVARLRERREYLLTAALLLGVAPSLLTGADALYMRAIISLPLILILTARGFWTAGSLFGRAFSRTGLAAESDRPNAVRRALPVLASVLLAGLLIWHAADSGTAYFVRWADAEQTQRIYNADFRAAARYLDGQPVTGEVFIGTDRLLDLDSRTYGFYEPDRADVDWFELPDSPPLPASGSALYLIPASAQPPPALDFLSAYADDRFSLPGPGGKYELMTGLRLSSGGIEGALGAAGVRPADERVSFGDALRLDGLGYRGDGPQGDLITQWTVLAPWPRSARPGFPFPQPKLAVSITDRSGYKWVQSDQVTSLPVQAWRPGQTVVEVTPVAFPADILPGDYDIRLAMYDDEDGPLPMRTAAGEETATPPVAGELQIVSRPRGDSPTPPFSVQETRSGTDLRPVGSWESPDKLIAGAPADLHVSWQALRPLETRDLHFRLRATAADGRLLWEQLADPVMPLPGAWPAGQTYRVTHRLQPEASEAGQVSVSLELCAEQADAALACAVVGQPTIVSRTPMLELPAPPQQTADARWDNALTLAGYDLARAGQAITLTLYWRTDMAPAAPLKRFVHAVNAGGEIVAQSDAPLESEGVPATTWRPGEYVVDRAVLDVPAGAQVSALYLGLYDPQTGERLPAYAASGDPLPEGRLTIDLQQASP